jgi:hypothetical protein
MLLPFGSCLWKIGISSLLHILFIRNEVEKISLVIFFCWIGGLQKHDKSKLQWKTDIGNMNLSFVGNMSKAKFILLTTHASDEKWHYFLAEEDAFLVMTKWSSFGERNTKIKKEKRSLGLIFVVRKLLNSFISENFIPRFFSLWMWNAWLLYIPLNQST